MRRRPRTHTPSKATQTNFPATPPRIHFSLPTGIISPKGRRLNLTIFDAQLTSEDGDSHVLSIGEFAALYLTVWSPAIWGSDVTGAKFAPDASKPNQNQTFRWDGALPPLVKGSPA